MNKEIKDKWIEALESGKYKQASHRLRSDEGFCCLGVLCDIMEPDRWDKNLNHRGLYLLPSLGVLAKAGLRSEECVPLSSANDRGVSFKEIAELIKRRF